ncbi:anaerobic ribonucleoside-triphosphate reductase [Symbiobacterium thermophilum]|uniref:anaerobic ribonucleoside-triphosphate reductase n=1 Tax=Symbiobacterium thermophilum TaxID=2734 RepID=UPI002355CDFD|nr:anaerobic ribonucleoside-triphosphate reductase [Symbiobacterium thermophilum]
MAKAVIKRDGRTVPFDSGKISKAMEKAFVAIEGYRLATSDLHQLTDAVAARLPERPSVEEIQDQVEAVLMEAGHHDVAKGYILYRQERTAARHRKERLHQLVSQIVRETGRENANVSQSPSAKLLQMAEAVGREFMERELTDPAVREAIEDGLLYPHDYAWGPIGTTTCVFIPLGKLLASGFNPGHGWVRSPRRIRTAAQLSMIILQSNQNDQHGGQAFGWYDRDLAPYVRLEYEWQVARIKADLEAVGIGADEIQAERIEKLAWERTRAETYQAMEGVVFNANTMHSRAGAQVPFVSINLGTDTSREGRLITESLLLAYEKGLGHGEQPIFPNLIFKVKQGVNFEPGDPNYDLLQLSLRVTAKRLFPNYVFQDASFNAGFPGDVPTMGCRTRVSWNIHKPDGEQTCEGRGNLSFTTLNLVGLALKARKELQVDGFSALAAKYEIELPEGTDLPQVRSYFCVLNQYADLAIQQLHQRFQYQCSFKKSDFPFLLNGVWMDSAKLEKESTLEEVWRHGTLSIGFIGLAETLVALIGKHHGESAVADALGVEIVRFLRVKADEAAKQYQLNYSLLATPAEGLTGKLVSKDRALWGEIPGVTDKEWYTNSFHVPVEYRCSAFHKIRVEGKYHAYCNAGHISYVELDEAPENNPEALMDLLRFMLDQDMGYVAFNFPVDRCRNCGQVGLIESSCPSCGSSDISRVRRITGYLAELSNFNEAKKAEALHRFSHVLVR